MHKRIDSEAKLQEDVIAWLKSNGCYVYRAMGNAMAAKGTPDILCCIDGTFVAFELKKEHNGAYGVTKSQEVRMRQIRKAGGLAYAVASVDEVERVHWCVVNDAPKPIPCAQCNAPISLRWWHNGLCEECYELYDGELRAAGDPDDRDLGTVNGVGIQLKLDLEGSGIES